MEDQFHLTISVRYANNTNHARAVRCLNASRVQLDGLKATATSGDEQAIDALLEKATPPLKRVRIQSVDRGETTSGPHQYHVVVEEAGNA